jgi:hypothetical protein
MISRSPTLEGFRTMFRRPSLGFAEVAWRWSFGAAASAVLAFGFIEYLDSLPVKSRDLILLETNRPALIWRAVSDILHGSGPRLAECAVLLACSLAIGWIVLASLGRAVTTRALLAHFRESLPKQPGQLAGATASGYVPLLGLNFLRATAIVAAIIASLVPWFFARIASAPGDDSIAGASLGFVFLVTLVWFSWYVLNWMLSLAALFVTAENRSTFDALRAAVEFSSSRFASVLAVNACFGLAHIASLLLAVLAVMFPLSLLSALPPGYAYIGALLVLLAYFVVVDFLGIGTMAAYVAILDGPRTLSMAEHHPLHPDADCGSERRGVDPDELILSDVPSPAD